MRLQYLLTLVAAIGCMSCGDDGESARAKKAEAARNDAIEEFLTKTTRIATVQGLPKIAPMVHSGYLSEYRVSLEPTMAEIMETVYGRVRYWRLPQEKDKRNKISDQEFWAACVSTVNEPGGLGIHLGTTELPDDYRVDLIGTVTEGDMTYAVVRQPQKYLGKFIDDLRVYGLKLENDGWRLIPSLNPAEIEKAISDLPKTDKNSK